MLENAIVRASKLCSTHAPVSRLKNDIILYEYVKIKNCVPAGKTLVQVAGERHYFASCKVGS
jgi:hypothetical protein